MELEIEKIVKDFENEFENYENITDFKSFAKDIYYLAKREKHKYANEMYYQANRWLAYCCRNIEEIFSYYINHAYIDTDNNILYIDTDNKNLNTNLLFEISDNLIDLFEMKCEQIIISLYKVDSITYIIFQGI